ncbi:MAG TPA: AI-2E family transporter [Acidobacteriaceae bacterium]
MDEPKEPNEPIQPVPLEPAQWPEIERPHQPIPEQPVGYTKMQRPAVESLGPIISGRATAGQHLRTAGTALVNWWRAVSIEALCVAVLWLIGLEILHVPLAPAWALVAGLMAFVPNIGGVIALIGPVFCILVTGKDLERLAFLLGIYAIIVVIDQLVLQPWLMKKTTRVPIWASILVPIVLGIVIPFWGVLLAPPLLAIVYAFRKPKAKRGLS